MRVATLFALFLCGCATRPSQLSFDSEAAVVIKCARLPSSQPWISRFADHCWIEFKGHGAVPLTTRRLKILHSKPDGSASK